jgi:O-antigen/teichoic acid export membrane protein
VTDDSLPIAEVRAAALKGLRWIVITRPTSELVSMASLVVCAHLIPPAEFGRFAVAAIVGELAFIPSAGVGAALVQRASVTRAHLQAGFALAILTGIVLVGLVLLVATTVVVPIFGERTAELVRFSTPGFFVAAASTVPAAVLQRNLEFRKLSIVDVVGSAAAAAVSIALAVAGLNGMALVLGVLAGGLLGTVLMCIWSPPPMPVLRREPAREVLGYGGPAALAAVSWIGFRNCDYAIVGARLGAFQAGLYFRAYTLGVEYQKKISKVMSSVGFPILARTNSSGDMDELRTRIVRLLTLLLFPLLAMLSIVAPVFVPWLFGHAWKGAIVPTQILAAGGAVTLVIDAAGAGMLAAGRPRALLGYGWAHFAAYGITVFLVAPLGLTAVAIDAAVVHGIFLLVAYILMLHGTGIPPLARLWRDVAPATVGCAVLVAAVLPVSIGLSSAHVSAVPYLAVTTTVATPAYVLALRIFFPESLRSLQTFASRVLPQRPLRAKSRRAALAASRSAS